MVRKTVVGFGEIMGRLIPEGHARLSQALPGSLRVSFGGAEANVCASIAQLGGRSRLVTALPANPLGDACVSFLRGVGVETDSVVRTPHGRLGLYFIEAGANQRPSQVVYDREHSAVALTPAADYGWDEAFEGAGWLHVSGITPAISQAAAEATQVAVEQAGARGLTVSCDLNFRKKLWRWDARHPPRELAEKTLRALLPGVQVLIANEEDASDVLGIRAGGSDVESGRLEVGRYPDVAAQIAAQFPNLTQVAITLRESLSASHNNWGAMLYDTAARRPAFAPLRDGRYGPYEIRNIVDRVGGGDAFAAGLIFALLDDSLCAQDRAVAFASAASCLAHSVEGDVNYVSRAEVEALMGGAASGRVQR